MERRSAGRAVVVVIVVVITIVRFVAGGCIGMVLELVLRGAVIVVHVVGSGKKIEPIDTNVRFPSPF